MNREYIFWDCTQKRERISCDGDRKIPQHPIENGVIWVMWDYSSNSKANFVVFLLWKCFVIVRRGCHAIMIVIYKFPSYKEFKSSLTLYYQ